MVDRAVPSHDGEELRRSSVSQGIRSVTNVMRLHYIILLPNLLLSLHCEGPREKIQDSPAERPQGAPTGAAQTPLRKDPLPPAPPNSLAAFEKNAKAEHRSFELSAGKAPTLSLSTDKKRFHLVLRANGWNDFSRHIEELRESSIKDVREIEIDLPQQACRFATPSSDARLHRCYYFERRNNEKPAEIRFVQGDQKVVTFSDGSLGQSLVVSESLALISTDGVGPEGKPTMSRHFELLLNISVFDSTQSATMNIELPLHFNHRE